VILAVIGGGRRQATTENVPSAGAPASKVQADHGGEYEQHGSQIEQQEDASLQTKGSKSWYRDYRRREKCENVAKAGQQHRQASSLENDARLLAAGHLVHRQLGVRVRQQEHVVHAQTEREKWYYLRRGGVKGDSQKRAETQSSCYCGANQHHADYSHPGLRAYRILPTEERYTGV